jgi:2-keto-4-pentenoate hydratase/2-oxohepta-3-ene-1,7-dioic acid hydratase in catechol pathway
MKLGRIALPGPDGSVTRIVAVHSDESRVVDLVTAEAVRLLARGATRTAAYRLAHAKFPSSMSEAIGLGDLFLDSAREADSSRGADASHPFAAITWQAAADPRVLRDCLTFPVHIKNAMHVVKVKMSPFLLHVPGFYKTSPSTIIGHNAEVPWPGYTNYMDYELELGIVVGREARNLTPLQAEEVIFGFTIFNDFSARDVIVTEMPIGLGPTKSKDFASGIGPWITTMDELGGIRNFNIAELKAVARVNGEVWTVGDTRHMIWSPAELLAYISQCDNLQPGDVIGSGTVGNGCTLELPDRRLKPGDVIELEVAGLGILRNTLGQPEPAHWWPTKRTNPLLPELSTDVN